MITRLTGHDFRNLAPLDWRPGPGVHLLVGTNGAGKTSVLEAIYLLATTRSFRGARPAECCRYGAAGFALEAEIETDRRLGLGLAWRSGGRVERRINGRQASPAEHLGAQPAIAWSAGDGALLDGPPALRRRLLDQGVVASRPAALELLGRYRRALEQKRRLLQEGLGGLEPWNELLAAAAAELIALRRAYVAQLQEALGAVLAEATAGLGPVELRYRPSPRQAAGPEEILTRLEAARGEELDRRQPLLGPHRDDVEIRWRRRTLRRAISAGERKLLGMALVAARGRVLAAGGREPVYLLDDVDGDLDAERLQAALRLFAGATQLLATSPRAEIWRAAPGRRLWVVEDGRIAAAAQD